MADDLRRDRHPIHAVEYVYQLAAEPAERLRRASHLLLIADGFNYLLSGQARAEESLASTTQLYNPRVRTWSNRLLKALDLPERLFPPLIPAGSRLGPVKAGIAREASLEVIASCSHDTGAAVAAVPAVGENWAYLSSGTWSLMGVEVPSPNFSAQCRELNFTNEIGFGGSVRLLKNIVGLWVVQECRREWAKAGRDCDYDMLTRLAGEAPPFFALIDPTDARFLSPDDMPAKIAAFCKETGQSAPTESGPIIRCVLESLALLYRRTLLQLEHLLCRKIERLHIVGGGSRNALLNQFTANAIQRPVLAGPVEATAAGNILVQAITLAHLSSLAQAREVVCFSSQLTHFEPGEAEVWDKAFERFNELAKRRAAGP